MVAKGMSASVFFFPISSQFSYLKMSYHLVCVCVCFKESSMQYANKFSITSRLDCLLDLLKMYSIQSEYNHCIEHSNVWPSISSETNEPEAIRTISLTIICLDWQKWWHLP